jgi:hypothetical protein
MTRSEPKNLRDLCARHAGNDSRKMGLARSSSYPLHREVQAYKLVSGASAGSLGFWICSRRE